ncbi:probable phosphomutase, MSMEG_4193 family [Raineyella antarctica]|uniref:Probable phosphomutase, MSMEG_4193 family n=1 Tax=Raineyella antarctica TaxID=1577474 RepID=A0A1G6HCG7_9ACTN|nr:MSMEG_4193 family putative phosphomutase [Raineyella antarctica]SDB91843.1 probable phosphomutase, MSMEG_4193 family [Raineyella antarctica]
MTILLLVRHGRTTANASGILAGRLPGVCLDETGIEQAREAGRRLAGLSVVAEVSSPMERCLQTADEIRRVREVATAADVIVDEALAEVDYGSWSGRPLKELAEEELWRTVQSHPSAATFPEGESMVAMAQRAVAAIRSRQDRIADEAGPEAIWMAVSHGDIIKAILADALGLHLDHFQRLVVNPASVSVVRYTSARPYVLATNTSSGALADLLPKVAPTSDDAVVGGGAGPGK